MRYRIATILTLGVFVGCKPSDGDSAKPYDLQCPATPRPVAFSHQGQGAWLPNAFSPNGDGKNDVLRMGGPDTTTFRAMSFRVIDSNGVVLAAIARPFAGWSGMNPATGKAYPGGVYLGPTGPEIFGSQSGAII